MFFTYKETHHLCGYRLRARTSAFQADNAGSNPATRSIKKYLIILKNYYIIYIEKLRKNKWKREYPIFIPQGVVGMG